MKELIQLHNAFKNVKFEEKSHTYTINGKKADISVSSFGCKYQKPFESEKIAFFVGRKKGKTKEEVLLEWKEIADKASQLGTAFHLGAENLFNNKIDLESLDKITPNMKKALMTFFNSAKDRFVLVKNELVLGYQFKNCLMGGMVDFLAYDLKDNCFCILDWKTNKELTTESKEYLLNEFSDIQDTKVNVYSIQLSLYKLIIEKSCPDIKIKKLILIGINDSSDKPKLVICKDFSERLEKILEN